MVIMMALMEKPKIIFFLSDILFDYIRRGRARGSLADQPPEEAGGLAKAPCRKIPAYGFTT